MTDADHMAIPLLAPSPLPATGAGTPTRPIPLAESGTARPRGLAPAVNLPADFVGKLRQICARVSDDLATRNEASRDWWPLAMIWATENQVPAQAAVVVQPQSTAEVQAILALCNEAQVPVTTSGGRSGVCGAAVPLYGGVVLDTTALTGINFVDTESQIVEVLPGTFGDHLETQLRGEYELTLGHWPQSISLSTVGGWLACRSAGQLSNRYGKIEDMVVGLEVVLANGEVVRTHQAPRQASGPDLTSLFVGSEGTLGVITRAWLRLHKAPQVEAHAAYGFESWQAGMEACRRILQRGANPAVLRLYDSIESARSYGTRDLAVLLVLDEGDPATVEANMAVTAAECRDSKTLDSALVRQWLGHRNEVSALESLIQNDFVVDTMEISGPWSALPAICEETLAALRAIPGVRAASVHQSHAYTDGACLYFTFAGRPENSGREAFYDACWEAGTKTVLRNGGTLSHHHGVGLNRSRFVDEALGSANRVFQSVALALDPNGILNPGKLGLPSAFGPLSWP